MSNHNGYTDWADWAGDNPEEAEAELRKGQPEHCEHAEVSGSGYCLNCAEAVEGWEPDDAQLLTQTGTRDVAA